MKYVILIPIYNDRESLKMLIENINNELKDINHEISIVVIYSKLPSRYSVCCQPYDQVNQDRNEGQVQGTTQMVMLNGQLMQLVPVNQTQPIGNINGAFLPNQIIQADNQVIIYNTLS